MPVVKCWSLRALFLPLNFYGETVFCFHSIFFWVCFTQKGTMTNWKRWRDVPGLDIYIYPCWRELSKHLFTLYVAPRDQRYDSTQVHLSEPMKDYLEEHGWLTYRQLCLQKACTTHKSCIIETPTPVHIPSPMYLSISICGLYIHSFYILPAMQDYKQLGAECT